MDWAQWEPWYEAILADLGYDREADEAARDDLWELLAHRRPAEPGDLAAVFAGEPAHVVGAGPSLPDLAPGDLPGPDEGVLVACDAAAARLLTLERVPDVIVTDLDGPRRALVAAGEAGALPVVHAHGDNREALASLVPDLPGPAATTQAAPRPPVYNWGGFTDGDRAAHVAAHHGAVRVRCHAFDLDEPGPGPTGDPAEKARKLSWARRLLAAVPVPVSGVDLEGVPGSVSPP